MKRIIYITLCMLIAIAFATQSKSDRYQPNGEILIPGATKIFIIDDTLPKQDTIWTSEIYLGSGFEGNFSISFDLDALNSAVTGSVLMRQGNERGNLGYKTTLFTYSAAVDTTIVIGSYVAEMYVIQFGFSNTSATDSIYIDNFSFFGTGISK